MLSVNESVLLQMKTNYGKSLAEISDKNPVILVFLRDFECFFCREAMEDISGMLDDLAAKGIQPIFVHMSNEEEAAGFLKKRGLGELESISDVEMEFYAAFGLGKGNFNQIFGLTNMIKGFDLMMNRKYTPKLFIGDGFQMPGVFVIKNRSIVYEFIHRLASDKPDYDQVIRESIKS